MAIAEAERGQGWTGELPAIVPHPLIRPSASNEQKRAWSLPRCQASYCAVSVSLLGFSSRPAFRIPIWQKSPERSGAERIFFVCFFSSLLCSYLLLSRASQSRHIRFRPVFASTNTQLGEIRPVGNAEMRICRDSSLFASLSRIPSPFRHHLSPVT